MQYHELIEIIGRVGMALLCGSLIGLERLISHKSAGMRTYAIASGGSALFVILSQMYAVDSNAHPQFILGQIIVGIGFLAAGSILMNKDKVMGLTTASGLWFMAAIGASFGYGYYLLGFAMTFLLLFTLSVLIKVEHYIINNFVNYEVESIANNLINQNLKTAQDKQQAVKQNLKEKNENKSTPLKNYNDKEDDFKIHF